MFVMYVMWCVTYVCYYYVFMLCVRYIFIYGVYVMCACS